MKSKAHFIVSTIKSLIRIGGCVASLNTFTVYPMAMAFLFAEALGILEEIVDGR